MRKQKEIWQKEHTKVNSIPSMASSEPSSGVASFVEFLKEKGIRSGKVLDIGCGQGRNSVYLSENGFDVWGIDYIKEALELTKGLADRKSVTLNLVEGEIDKPWPFEDNFFDIEVDSFSSIDIESKEGRETYRDELLRTLKPGGHALVTVVSADDELESQMIKNSPGLEKNSTVWPDNQKFQKDYDEEELREFYKDFKILELKEISKPARKLGKDYIATNFWLVLQKN